MQAVIDKQFGQCRAISTLKYKAYTILVIMCI